MALKIVGSGLGRTGTKSMHTALGMLGFGPCHHMFEVLTRPESMALWVRASKGEAVWDQIFEGFAAMVDYPGAHHWRELAAYYPDAIVLHTVRDPDKWFDSTQATIFSPENRARFSQPGPVGDFFQSFLGPIVDKLGDRAFMTNHFERHTDVVIAAIPPERLLVYEVGSGWTSLCARLGVAEPAEPYPCENSTKEFRARMEARRNA